MATAGGETRAVESPIEFNRPFVPIYRAVLSNGSLVFTSVQHTRNERPDEGLYQCAATRPSVGTIISRAAKLQIATLPRFESEPKDASVRAGHTARFNCLVLVNDLFPQFLFTARLPSGTVCKLERANSALFTR